MKKIVTVLGARPQFVKAAVLSRVISEQGDFQEVIVHTGQHFDANMSAVFFSEMQIPTPKYNLDINGLSHGAMTGQMLEKIEDVLKIEKPDVVVVYGDTNSTFAGAMAAKKMQIKVVHIEAGLRSFNMKMPEEINRILTDRISDLLLCPTDTAVQNLKDEGFINLENRLVKCGDIMKDAVQYYSAFSEDKSTVLKNMNLQSGTFVLATIHRQENTDDIEKLKALFEGLSEIHTTQTVVLPLHPRTQKILEKYHLEYPIVTCAPLGYFDMLEMLKHCSMVVTDSGGLQKEAFFNRKMCIVAREQTEWVELVKSGYATLVGSDTKKLIKAFEIFRASSLDFSENLYGNDVGVRIHKEIKKLLAE
ncbi:MAG: non-hydrolyzing UDP-N-acetylglucosamine 2-epimerase [Flavicella sp.]